MTPTADTRRLSHGGTGGIYRPEAAWTDRSLRDPRHLPGEPGRGGVNRRRLLAWLGSAGALGFAGCSNQQGPTASPTDRTHTATGTRSPSPTRRPATDPSPSTATDSPTDTDTETATETPTDTDTEFFFYYTSFTEIYTERETPRDTETDSPPSEEETATETPHEGLQRTVSLASVDPVPAGFEVEMEAELLRSRVTDAETARLRITTTNTGSPRSISVAPDDCSLLNRSKGGSDRPAGLWLHDPERAERIDRDGSRWEADRDSDEPRAYAMYGCLKKEYAEGEAVSNEYVLWSDYRVGGYMEPGTYRWEEEVSVSDGETPTGTADGNSFTWGFSLTVSEP